MMVREPTEVVRFWFLGGSRTVARLRSRWWFAAAVL